MTSRRHKLLDAQHPDDYYVRQQTDGITEIIRCCEMPATGGFTARNAAHDTVYFQLDDLPLLIQHEQLWPNQPIKAEGPQTREMRFRQVPIIRPGLR